MADSPVRFIAKISSMGDKFIILIPKERHAQAKKLKGKYVRVIVEEVTV